MPRLTKAEILSLSPQQIEQLRRHNLQQLKRITSDIQAINKKSYKRLTSKNIRSPFVTGYEKAGGTPSLRGMSDYEIKAEFETQLSLMKAQTRTMKGSQKVYSEMASKIDPEGKVLEPTVEMSNDDLITVFWDVYHKWSQMHPVQTDSGGSPPVSVSEMIFKNINENTFKKISVKDMKKDHPKMYDNRINSILEEVNSEYNEWYQRKKEEEARDLSPDSFDIPGENY